MMKHKLNDTLLTKISNLVNKNLVIKGYLRFLTKLGKIKLIRIIRNEIFSLLSINWNWWRISLLSNNYVESHFLDYVIDKIQTPEIILDLGSGEAMQSIEFSIIFPNAHIFAFECDPQALKICKQNIVFLKKIELIPKAVYNEDRLIKFYPVINKKGSSALFKISNLFKESIGDYLQEEIEVEAIRIDTWAKQRKINKIDLCWLDLQGAEYEALEGLGDLIYNIQALYVEVEQKAIYEGQRLIQDVIEFLTSKGFSMIKYHPTKAGWWGNAIFLNNKLLPKT